MPFISSYNLPEVLAAAGIAPCVCIRFTANKTVNIPSASTQEVIGITDEWSELPPIPAYSLSANEVSTGKPVPYKGRGMTAKALVGVGGVTGGTRVMSNATTGAVIAHVAGASNWSVGIALDTATAGEYVDVWVDPVLIP